MTRIHMMTTGLVLVLFGVQLFLVKSYVLTPDASKFVAERFKDSGPTGDGIAAASVLSTPFTPAATSIAQKKMSPPTWLCWPVMFLGTVMFLHGITIRRMD